MGPERHSKRAILGHALLPGCVALYLTWMAFDVPNPPADTFGYMSLSAGTSLGYSLLLRILDLISDATRTIIYIQIWFSACAVFYLALVVRKATASNRWAQFLILPILLNPFVIDNLFAIKPDSFVLSISMMMLAFLLSAFCSSRFISLFGFGLCIGLVISLDPIGWAYLPLLIITAPLITQRGYAGWKKAFLVPTFACLLVVSFEAVTYKNIFDEQPRHLASPYLFANTALMPVQQETPYVAMDPRNKVWQKIETNLEDTRTKIWEANLEFAARFQELRNAQNTITHHFAKSEIQDAAYLLDKTPEQIQMDIAIARIVQSPLVFLEIIVDQYRGVWSILGDFTYPLMALSAFALILGLWFWIVGSAFNAMFLLTFISAYVVQAAIIFQAHCGLGITNIALSFTPILTTILIAAFLGFYTSVINPVRIDD